MGFLLHQVTSGLCQWSSPDYHRMVSMLKEGQTRKTALELSRIMSTVAFEACYEDII